MSVILDTNILVRSITLDPARQGKAAADLLKSHDVVIPTVAICEMIWVLRRLYKLSQSEVKQSVKALLAIDSVTLDRAVVEAGLKMMEAGGDFADGVIAFEGHRLGGEAFASFDRKAVALLQQSGEECLLLDGE